MKLQESLREIGFSDKEAQLYLQLIHLGPQTASVLSRHTNINRTTIYDILDLLKGRGIVKSIKKSGSTSFQAMPPIELIRFLEREKEEAISKLEKQQKAVKSILPELLSLTHAETNKPKITFHEGEKGMREAYEDTLSSDGPILAYANVEEMHASLPHFFPEYYHRRAIEHGIHIKAILPDNPSSIERAKLDKKENRESVLVPKDEYGFSPEINIYNNKVLITSWKERLSILIESKEIADFHRKMHKLCWDRAKELARFRELF